MLYNIWCKGGVNMSTNYKNKILNRIENAESDWVFIADDFFDIACYETVRSTLNRLVDNGTIKRIIKGFYYQPKYYEILDDYESVSIPKLADAIARKYNWTIAPSGNTSLNLLGLDTAVPSKWSYISDGRYHKVLVGNTIIEFKHRKGAEITKMTRMTAMVIQAIKTIGKDRINKTHICHLRSKLTKKQKNDLLNEAKSSSKWIYSIIRKICKEEDSNV